MTKARSAALGCLAILALAAGASPAAARSRQAINLTRAMTAYQDMQRVYYNPPAGLYRYATAWSYSQAMAATISVAALNKHLHHLYAGDLIARLRGLQAYADHTYPTPSGYDGGVGKSRGGPGGDRFNDDNEWIGIELIRQYHINHQRPLLKAASDLLAMIYSQWDQDPAAPCPGGVPWQDIKLNADRNTVSNATGAELGAQVYITTHQASALQEAQNMYNWVRTCLVNPDGLIADHITAAGNVDTTEWTYNQGTMIGAGVMLYQATHNVAYLQQSEALAQTALHDFGAAALAQQPTAFNAIYIRNLLLLGGASGDKRYQRFAQWFANDAWSNVRDDSSGLFLSGAGGSTELLDQAAMVQVYALLSEPRAAYF